MITITTLARILGLNEDKLREIFERTLTFYDAQRDRIHEPDVIQFLEEQYSRSVNLPLIRREVRAAIKIETPY